MGRIPLRRDPVYGLAHLRLALTEMTDQSTDRAAAPARYDFANAEPRWQAEWNRRACFEAPALSVVRSTGL